MAQAPVMLPSKPLLQNIASGALVMTIFGTLWASLGIAGLDGWGGLFLWPVVIIVFVALFGTSIYYLRSARHLPAPDEALKQEYTRRRRLFGLIVAIEVAAIAITSTICSMTRAIDIMVPAMTLIIGLHFFSARACFQTTVLPYYGLISLYCNDCGCTGIACAHDIAGWLGDLSYLHLVGCDWILLGGRPLAHRPVWAASQPVDAACRGSG